MFAPQSMKVVGDRGLFRTSFGRKTASLYSGRWSRRAGPPCWQRKTSRDLDAPLWNLKNLKPRRPLTGRCFSVILTVLNKLIQLIRKDGGRMININFRDARPIYEQVRDGFRQLILTGVLPADSKLPSVRELAAELAINPNTIQRAYRELEAEGYICSVPGRGSFVLERSGALEARKAQLRRELEERARELRQLGVTTEELIAWLEGGHDDDPSARSV